MIKHLEFFRFNSEDNETLDSLVENASEKLAELSKLNCIESLTIHKIIKHAAYENFDLLVDCSFKNYNQLKEYQEHPKHSAFVSWVENIITDRACVDFELLDN